MAREGLRLKKAYIKQLEPRRDTALSEYQETFAVALGNIFYAVELIMDETRVRQWDVGQLANRFIHTARAYDSVIRQHSKHSAEGGSHTQCDCGSQLRRLKPEIEDLAKHVPDDFRDHQRTVNEMRLRKHHVDALTQALLSR